jgi:hypothetical protein
MIPTEDCQERTAPPAANLGLLRLPERGCGGIVLATPPSLLGGVEREGSRLRERRVAITPLRTLRTPGTTRRRGFRREQAAA